MERDAQEAEVSDEFYREIEQLREAASDLVRICSDPDEAARYFAVVGPSEVVENEFNLNVPRYVETFEPDTVLPLPTATEELELVTKQADIARDEVLSLLAELIADEE